MLRSLQDVFGAAIVATDGELGKISNFLFDDQSWRICYLVVDVGRWLAHREVLISVRAINQPDWGTKTFPAHLTREEVRNSPDVDSKKPVSRQQEIAMCEYFRWPTHWDDWVKTEIPGPALPAGRKFPVHTKEDPDLRSAENMIGYEVWANDGLIGRLEHFIVDEASWHIGYLDVKTGDWLHNRSMLVPTRWVMSVSWANHRVNLNHDWSQV